MNKTSLIAGSACLLYFLKGRKQPSSTGGTNTGDTDTKTISDLQKKIKELEEYNKNMNDAFNALKNSQGGDPNKGGNRIKDVKVLSFRLFISYLNFKNWSVYAKVTVKNIGKTDLTVSDIRLQPILFGHRAKIVMASDSLAVQIKPGKEKDIYFFKHKEWELMDDSGREAVRKVFKSTAKTKPYKTFKSSNRSMIGNASTTKYTSCEGYFRISTIGLGEKGVETSEVSKITGEVETIPTVILLTPYYGRNLAWNE